MLYVAWCMLVLGIMDQRTIIKLCVKLQKSFTETFAMIRTAFGDNVVSCTTVHTWFKQFKEGRNLIEDDKMCEDNADGFVRLKRAHTP